jgi:hypothetical protein
MVTLSLGTGRLLWLFLYSHGEHHGAPHTLSQVPVDLAFILALKVRGSDPEQRVAQSGTGSQSVL